jgi:hypothetical protein
LLARALLLLVLFGLLEALMVLPMLPLRVLGASLDHRGCCGASAYAKPIWASRGRWQPSGAHRRRAVLAHASAAQWDAVQALVRCRCVIVWATAGAQPAPRITATDATLVYNLFRTLRAEDPALRLTTLDVAATDNSDSDNYSNALSALQRLLLAPSAVAAALPRRETAVVVRGGVECVTRLQNAPARCVLGSARIGSLDALRFAKLALADKRIEAGHVEIKEPSPRVCRAGARGAARLSAPRQY